MYRQTVVILVLTCVSFTISKPVQDVEVVESTIREVRAVAPDLHPAEANYEHNYGGDDEDSIGYLKRSDEGGSDGYKHFDSYHKKDGDNYGYEKHTSFGKATDAEHDSNDEANDKGSYKVTEEINEDDGPSEKITEGDNEHYEEITDDHNDESAKYSADEEAEGDGDY